jgi:uncharacterized protein YcaQ
MLKLSKKDARRLLVSYHFQPTSLRGAFQRLGSIQYDPLNPVGRNHDLVLQARVPGYRVGDWEELAYLDRFIYDSWDKQASLVLMSDYPKRRIYHDWHAQQWNKKILTVYPEAVEKVLDELRRRGPLRSTDFYYQEHQPLWEGSWYGPKLTKNILRALWHTGQVQTSSRNNGNHVYDLAARVIPQQLYRAEPLSQVESIEWLILLRHQALGLMRPNVESAVWGLGITAKERRTHIQSLLKRDLLKEVEVDGKIYHALPQTIDHLDMISEPEKKVRFVAPLDQLMWDRAAIAHMYGFDYVWEVYKPERLRRWGYYVLPVMFADRFVARIDSRLSGGIWHVYKWYWEGERKPTAEVLDGLEKAVSGFRFYLGASTLKLPRGLDKHTRGAFRSGFKATCLKGDHTYN